MHGINSFNSRIYAKHIPQISHCTEYQGGGNAATRKQV